MRKLRVLCWLLSAYLLCCSAFAAPSANAFYEYDPVANGLEITPFAINSSYTTKASISATASVRDSKGVVSSLDFSHAFTDSTSGYDQNSKYIYKTFTNNKATLTGWTLKGTVTFTYDLGEAQVVTLSGVPNLTWTLSTVGSNYTSILVTRSTLNDTGFNWTVETDSSVATSIESPNGWNSGVAVSEVVLTCEFGITITGLNQSFTTVSNDTCQIRSRIDYSPETMKVGSGGDPNTGILSGIASVLSGLIELVQGIYNAVTNIPNLIQNIISAIASLPGLIVDGIKNLFIPSQQDLETLKANYETMLEQKLGFVWQVGDWLTSFANTMISAFTGGTSYTFEFPGISFSMNGETHEIVPAQTVSLENAFMSVMRPVLGTAVSFICIIAFIRLGEHMLTAVVSGVSYFEFLKGDGG